MKTPAAAPISDPNPNDKMDAASFHHDFNVAIKGFQSCHSGESSFDPSKLYWSHWTNAIFPRTVLHQPHWEEYYVCRIYASPSKDVVNKAEDYAQKWRTLWDDEGTRRNLKIFHHPICAPALLTDAATYLEGHGFKLVLKEHDRMVFEYTL